MAKKHDRPNAAAETARTILMLPVIAVAYVGMALINAVSN